MADASSYYRDKVANLIRGGGAGVNFTAPSAVYVKLHTGAPGLAATSNASAETTRQEIQFGAASSGVITSTTTPTWSSWSAGTETISHISVWDASTSGNALWTAQLTASKTVSNGDTFRLNAGDVTFTAA